MKTMLTTAERDQIASLVAKVEEQTASELVAVVYSKSASYAAFRISWAGCLGLGLTSVVHLLWPQLPVMELFGLQALIALGSYGLLGYSPLLQLIVPPWAKEQAVHDKVRLLFLEHGVTETRHRSGVIIYLSQLERRVAILGDRGIHEQLGPEVWQKLVDELVGTIRGGHAATGILHIIEQLSTELIAKFPVREDDTNELPNHVITDKR